MPILYSQVKWAWQMFHSQKQLLVSALLCASITGLTADWGCCYTDWVSVCWISKNVCILLSGTFFIPNNIINTLLLLLLLATSPLSIVSLAHQYLEILAGIDKYVNTFSNTCWPVTTLKPLIVEMNNTAHLGTVQYSAGGPRSWY